MMFCVPVLAEMPTLFKWWLGDYPAHAIIFCQLLLVKTLIYQLVLPLNTSIQAVGDIKTYEISKSFLAFFPLIIGYMFFSMGLPAYFIYIVFIVEALFSSIITLFFCRRYCDLNISEFVVNVFIRCVLSFIIVLLLVFSVGGIIENDFIRLIVKTSSSIMIFVFAVYFIGLNKEEKHMSIMIIKKIWTKCSGEL